MIPGQKRIVENGCDKELAYVPALQQEGGIWIAERFLKECAGRGFTETESRMVDGESYVSAKTLKGTGYVSEYYPDKNMLVFAREGMIPGKEVKSRTSV